MEFKLPDIGEGVAEGEITRWLVKEGDSLSPDQPMVEVMTDKATVELPSPSKGVVEKIFVKEGETVPVGKVILSIREEGAQATPPKESKPVESKVERKVEPAAAPRTIKTVSETKENTPIEFHVLATPATRKLARELGINLNEIKGTGSSGRVTKEDVQLAYEVSQAGATRSSHPAPVAMTRAAVSSASTVNAGQIEKIPLRGIRKKIAEAMAHSKHTAAHFTYVEEVDMTEVVKLRAEVKPEAEKRGIKLTFLPFIIKAVIPALKDFPYFNSSLDDERQEILLKGFYNIGVATDTPNGLMVPVIKDADKKSIWELAESITDLSEKVRSGKAAIEDLRGGTFTLTNAGSLGGVLATPVINHPEVAILGVNAIRKRPVVNEKDEIVVRQMMYLSISVDHRVVDGADAARFMNQLVFYLSDPKRLIFV